MVFRKCGGLYNNGTWTYKGISLEIVDNFDYLGTVFNYTGNFALNQETLVGKGLIALNCLLYDTKNMFWNLKLCVNGWCICWFHLNYVCEIWGFGKCKEIEEFIFKFCKKLLNITKTRLYNFDPLKPHFYIVKLGFTGVYIIFLISAQKHRLWVLVRTASARRF